MLPTPKLAIIPKDVTGEEEQPHMVQIVYDALGDSELAIYGTLPDEFEPMEAFVAGTPYRALQWICQRISRPKLVQIIQYIYDHPEPATNKNDHPDTSGPALDADTAGTTEDIVGTGKSQHDAGTKRKRGVREKTAREVNKALVEKMNLALVQTVANSQDWEHAKAPEGISIDERRYRNFAKRLPGIGLNTVAQMITKAAAVGTMDVFKDWQAILAVWKRQKYYGKKLFQGVAASRVELITQGQGTLQSSQQLGDNTQLSLSLHTTQYQTDEAGLTYLETETFRFKYFDAQKTQVDGIADDMRHRWKMDELFEEYERLEKEVRKRNEGTGARGRRYETVAKEHLFASVYRVDLGRRPTKIEDPDLWLTFGQYLDWGKRWNILKKRFGSVGIFGLLPRSVIPNAFVEKQLSQTRVAQWIEMVAECNDDVSAMALRMEPLFLACMQESEPPTEFLFLEQLDHYADTRPLALFEINSDIEEGLANHDNMDDNSGIGAPLVQ